MEYFPTASLSETTKRKYNTYISRWLGFGIGSLNELIRDAEGSIERLKGEGTIKQTRHVYHSYYSSIVAYIEHEGTVELREYKRKWKEIQTENYKPIGEKYVNQEATERQKETMLEWGEVLRIRDSLPSGIEKLLLGFYSYIEPVRGDYYATKLLKEGESIPEKENYIIMGTECKLVIKNFKTSKTYESIEHILPSELKELLEESLRTEPRGYLFIKRRASHLDPIVAMSSSEYTSWANRIMTRIFGKATNLTALRHAFVHTIDYNKPLKELKKITDAMGHSISMSMAYKLKK